MAYFGVFFRISSSVLCGVSSIALSGVFSGISSGVLFGFLSGVLFGVSCGGPSGGGVFFSGALFGVLSGVVSGALSGNTSGVLSGGRGPLPSPIGRSALRPAAARPAQQNPVELRCKGRRGAVLTAIGISRLKRAKKSSQTGWRLKSGAARLAVEARRCPLR